MNARQKTRKLHVKRMLEDEEKADEGGMGKGDRGRIREFRELLHKGVCLPTFSGENLPLC